MLALAFSTESAHAVPFVPERDDQVLEVLPQRGAAYVPADVRALHEQLRQRPGDLQVAVDLATRLVAIGREAADPRMYGQAEAALKPWLAEAAPPPQVLLLRASIQQFNHQFAAALIDLERYLTARPDDAAARLVQATVLMVTAQYAKARDACGALPPGRSLVLVRATCLAEAQSFLGDAPKQYATLNALAGITAAPDAATTAYVFGTLGAMAIRLDRRDEAVAHFRRALAASPNDLYALVTLADLLLDMDKPAEAMTLLAGRVDQDALLLRIAVAAKRSKRADADTHRDALVKRFTEERERGARPHLREEAYFQLYVAEDAKAAVKLAQTNYESQREPVDARVLLAAAAAAGDREAAAPILAWLKATASADPVMTAAAARLEGKP